MSKSVKVILSKNHGFFEPNREYQELLRKKGMSWWELKARTDLEIIGFIEQNRLGNINVFQVGKEYYQYASIVEIDTTKPWTIEEYDGAEYIKYIEYEVLDEKLNYCKFL
ncbi:hypothetical protein KDN24_06420 [Bacillus sp. Bva_UNVM-123]|uniref:hypothetical protein n=1 Tax=Bacillus sp. Bva_UNVM-123 TaxID=2829798 RepID=UPI00391FA453